MTASSLRAVARLGRRSALRHPRRTALVVGLVALAVALAVFAGVAARTLADPPGNGIGFSRAAARLSSHPAPPEAESAVDDHLGAVLAADQWHRFRTAFTRSAWRYLEVQDLDLTHPLTRGDIDVLAGRPPAAPGEVALTTALLEAFGVAIGDDLAVEVDGGEVTGRVVGELRDPQWLDRTLAVVVPDDLEGLLAGAPGRDTSWLVGDVAGLETVIADAQQAWAQAERRERAVDPAVVPPELQALAAERPTLFAGLIGGELDYLAELSLVVEPGAVIAEAEMMAATAADLPLGVFQRSMQGGDDFLFDDPPVVSTLVAMLLLIEVALLAAAAYTTGMRRRLREVGLLLANGATGRQVRLALAAEGALAGAAGAALGVAAGLAAGLASLPLFQLTTNRLLESTTVSPVDVIGPAVVGVAAATLAAWWPARAAGRVAPVTALAGRMPVGRPPGWVVPVAVAATALGLAILAAGRGAADNSEVLALLSGGIVAIGGMALLAVPIMGWLGNVAGRFPLLGRIAVRDASRQRARAAAAIAAIMAILLVPLTTATAISVDQRRSQVQGLDQPADLVWVQRGFNVTDRALPATEDEIAIAQSIVPGARRIDVSMFPVAAGYAPLPSSVDTFAIVFDGFTVGLATPELLAAVGVEEHADVLDAGSALVLGVAERSRPLQVSVGGEVVTVPAEEVPVAMPFNAPRVLVSEDLAADLGFPEPGGATLFALDRDVTHAEYNALLSMPAGVSVGAPVPFLVRHVEPLTAAGALLLALVVIAMVLSLAATESDLDLRTMVAVGAEPRLRRRFLAAQAGLFVLIAAVLALPLSQMLLNALSDRDGFVAGPFGEVSGGFAVPWAMAGAVIVAMPVITALLTGLVARSAPVQPLRRID